MNAITARQIPASSFNWLKLPTITFEINANDPNKPGKTFKMTIGPRQYLQQDDQGFWKMQIGHGSDSYIVLGLPIFSAFHILLDRDKGSIGFSLGCG